MTGTLHIVATPIGNLSDISQRALEILAAAKVVYCEDTRVTKKLTARFGINTPLKSYHQHSSDDTKFRILHELNSGKDLALVTDAGTPGISDPGNELIDFLLESNPRINVSPVPGASSLTAALSVCGFKVSRFIFLGFLPKKRLNTLFDQVKDQGCAIVFYESPHRIGKTLAFLREKFNDDKRIYIGRELTKLHEEYYRGSITKVSEQLASSNPKGEIVVVIEGGYGS